MSPTDIGAGVAAQRETGLHGQPAAGTGLDAEAGTQHVQLVVVVFHDPDNIQLELFAEPLAGSSRT
jgi:hypothetical protein